MWVGQGVWSLADDWGFIVCVCVCVCGSWLFDCAVARTMVPVEPHLLSSEPPTSAITNIPEGEGVFPPTHVGVRGEGCVGEDMGALPLEGVVICFNKKLPSLSSEQCCDM